MTNVYISLGKTHRERMRRTFPDRVDALNNCLGRFASWLTLAMVLIASYNAIARYFDKFITRNFEWFRDIRLTSNSLLELQWYLFSLMFLLGGAYALRENAHVRVDVIYARLKSKTKSWINVLGGVFFLIPFCLFMGIASIQPVVNSWKILEISPDPNGLPRYPIKTFLPIAFFLLFLQGFSQLCRERKVLRGNSASAEGKESS